MAHCASSSCCGAHSTSDSNPSAAPAWSSAGEGQTQARGPVLLPHGHPRLPEGLRLRQVKLGPAPAVPPLAAADRQRSAEAEEAPRTAAASGGEAGGNAEATAAAGSRRGPGLSRGLRQPQRRRRPHRPSATAVALGTGQAPPRARLALMPLSSWGGVFTSGEEKPAVRVGGAPEADRGGSWEL